tara:strand:+ start:221 stop:1396 length:1176 start_codon:yes stop_codon:yes gene_type:complete
MSVGKKLQDMENIEENVVTKGAKPAEPMQKLSTGGTPATWEDLGGPTPENSKPDDDSNKLKTPGTTLAQVKNVVNQGAKAAEAVSDEVEEGQEVVAEEPAKEEEVVAEEPTTDKEEVVAEEETTETTAEQEVVAEEEATEEEVVAEDKIDVEEDLNALIAGEELSEEFQNKARTIFETAIKTKVAEIKDQVQEEYKGKLEEEVAGVRKELVGRVDSYLEYVADEWMTENKLAVEHGLKTEMTESFLNGMRGLFEEHYVTIPEEKYDVIESMVDKLDEMEGKLNEQIEKNVALNKRLSESVSDVILADVSEGLALSQKEKLESLAENVEFDSEDTYREKLVTLRESYFSAKAPSAQRDNAETISESADQGSQTDVTPRMESYLSILSRAAKK